MSSQGQHCLPQGSTGPAHPYPCPLPHDTEGPPHVSLGEPEHGLSPGSGPVALVGEGHRAFFTFASTGRCHGFRGLCGARAPLTFYYVLPGKAPLRLGSEKQATARVILRAVWGKMFMTQK